MQYLTIEQTAEMLNVHPSTVRRMLPQLGAVDLAMGMKGKRLVRIPERAVQIFLRDCTIQPISKERRKTRCATR